MFFCNCNKKCNTMSFPDFVKQHCCNPCCKQSEASSAVLGAADTNSSASSGCTCNPPACGCRCGNPCGCGCSCHRCCGCGSYETAGDYSCGCGEN